MTVLIGSMCSGYGGLDAAVQAVIPSDLAWVADPDPGATKILTHHHPHVPNLGDITTVDWATVPAVDILTAGFPCQDISNAGKRAGIEGERSGIWTHVVEAVRVVRPRLVFLENVAALTSRGLDRVAADLAEVGFVGSWRCVRASDVGAPHRRERIFILAWPADAAGPGLEAGWEGRPGGGADAHPESDRRDEGRTKPAGEQRRPDVAFGGGSAAAHPEGVGHGHPGASRVGGVPSAVVGGASAWGPYGPAIRRWEHVTGRVAPVPTEPGRTGQPRLSPAFVEWLMGLPEGHVIGPEIGLTRNQQLRALGNGVVPQQGAMALRMLLERASVSVAA